MNAAIFALALCSGTLHAIWNFFSKKKASDLPVMVMGLWLANVTLLPVSLLIINNTGFDFRCLPFLLVAALADDLYYILIIKSYKIGDISLAYPLSRGTSVLFITIFSMLFLGETVSGAARWGIGLIICGIMAFGMSKGYKIRDFLNNVKSQRFAFFLGFSTVMYTLVDRVGVTYCNPLVYFNLQELFAMAILTPFVFTGALRSREGVKKLFLKEWKYSAIIGYGIMGSYGIILFIYAMFAEAKASYVTPIREISVVLGSVLGFIFLRERITVNKILGILFMVLGVILIKVG